MAISSKMQDWVAEEIQQRLDTAGLKLKVESKQKTYAGAWRNIPVDVHVHTDSLGLAVAIDPKHLQSRESINKNWKNMLNDIIAFGANMHGRYPMCVVGAVVGFNAAEMDNSTLEDMFSIIGKVAIRESPSEQTALLEGLALVGYECEPRRLSITTPRPASPFWYAKVFDRMAGLVVQRFVG
jgi:hypothetical protein